MNESNNSNESTKPKPPTVRKVTAPLSMDQLKESLQDPHTIFLINTKESTLKGMSLLTYLSNLEIPAELDLSNSSPEEIEELMAAYFSTKSIVNSQQLAVIAGQIVLDFIGCDSDLYYSGCFLNKEQRAQFFQKHKDLVESWAVFISSSLIYGFMSFPAIEEKEKFKERLPRIENLDAVGLNIVNLFGAPGFMEVFFTVPPKYQPYYYKFQFEDYMFKGKNLFHYYASEKNMISVLQRALLLSEEGPEKLIKAAFGTP